MVALTTDIYAVIRQRLAKRGIPPEEVAFIHDAKDTRMKERLFRRMNDGQVRVLIGSTEKMSTGMNVQKRLVATHHLTPPWRPADIAQQIGRMIRQGNLYKKVAQLVYITRASFDGYSWQTLETKAGFIAQVDAEYSAREAMDVSDNVLTFSEIKALAAGNPKVREKIMVDAELLRLEAVYAAWKTNHRRLKNRTAYIEFEVAELRKRRSALERAIATRDAHPQPKDKFSVRLRKTLDDPELETFAKRDPAGQRLRLLIEMAKKAVSPGKYYRFQLGVYRGLEIEAIVIRFDTETVSVTVGIKVGDAVVEFSVTESNKGTTMSMTNLLRKLDQKLAEIDEKIGHLEAEKASLEGADTTWEFQEKYDALKEKSALLHAEIEASGDDAEVIDLDALAAGHQSTDEDIVRAQAILEEALAEIRAMHADPNVLKRFGLSTTAAREMETVLEEKPTPIPEVAELEAQITQTQAELARLQFALAAADALPNETVQLDMFGGYTTDVRPRRRKRRRKKLTQEQLALFG